jgi:hypothetical protein
LDAEQENKIIATRLLVKVPSYITHHEKSKIIIVAVDSKGRVDRTRTDEIEIVMEPMYEIENSKVKIDTNAVRLVNGEAQVGISSQQSEFVKITASCKDRKTGLEPYTVLMATGGFPFHR